MQSKTIESMLSQVGDAIRELRLQRNLMQQTLAERSGVSVKAVRNLEGGDGVSLRSFLAICRTLGKTDWLKTLPPPMGGFSPLAAMKRLESPQRRRASTLKRGEFHG